MRYPSRAGVGDRPRGISLLCALLCASCSGGSKADDAPKVQRLTTGPFKLVGTEVTACTQQDSPADGDTWCALFRQPSDSPGTELWVLNATQALEAPVTCDGKSLHCLRLTSNLWTKTPITSPIHPEVHGFDGRSLFFYADADPAGDDEPYTGSVKVWRPGWKQARTITSGKGFLCYGHRRAAVAFCLDSVVPSATNVEFDLLAGSVADPEGGPLALADHVRARGSRGQVLWGTAFSPDGRYLAVSSPAAATDAEELRVAMLEGLGPPRFAVILPDASRWQISADGNKIYYIKDFGDHPAQPEIDRSGTLMMADFPAGANAVPMAERVPDFLALGSPGAAERGVAFLQDTVDGAGKFKVIRDRTGAPDAIEIAGGVEYFEISPDARYAFLEEPGSSNGGPAGLVARLDGAATPCIFSVVSGYPIFHPVYAAGLVFWGDQIPEGKHDVEGWLADAEGCGNKKRFTDRLTYLDALAGGILYGEYENQEMPGLAVLRYARVADGVFPPAGGEVIRRQVDRRVLFSPGLRRVFFTVSTGFPSDMGLYAHGPLP